MSWGIRFPTEGMCGWKQQDDIWGGASQYRVGANATSVALILYKEISLFGLGQKNMPSLHLDGIRRLLGLRLEPDGRRSREIRPGRHMD